MQQPLENVVTDSPRREETNESDVKKASQLGNRLISRFHKSVQGRQIVLLTDDRKVSSILKSTMTPKSNLYESQ